jgi:Na+/H+ antiporter NhaC
MKQMMTVFVLLLSASCIAKVKQAAGCAEPDEHPLMPAGDKAL